MRRTFTDEEQGGGTSDLAMLPAIAGREADGAIIARTQCRIPFRVRCNERDGGVGPEAGQRRCPEGVTSEAQRTLASNG